MHIFNRLDDMSHEEKVNLLENLYRCTNTRRLYSAFCYMPFAAICKRFSARLAMVVYLAVFAVCASLRTSYEL